jgi:hypothetical protein
MEDVMMMLRTQIKYSISVNSSPNRFKGLDRHMSSGTDKTR